MFKNTILYIVIITLFISCEKEHPANYMSISGKIENTNDSVLTLTGFSVKKRITLESDGTFKDSLKISKVGYHTLLLGNSIAYLYLKNGYDLNFTVDANNFFKSFQFDGNKEGAHTNQLIVDRYKLGQSAGNVKGFMMLDKDPFLKKIERFRNGMDSISKLYPKANAELVKNSDAQNEQFFKTLTDNYDGMHDKIIEEEKALEKLQKGKPAPEFVDFENYKGGKSSLSDYKGKYVYIDVWATWCKPCIAQIPYLKKLQEKYKDKNIVFLSISTDDIKKTAKTWKEAGDKWRKMVKEKNLGGEHLWAGENINFSYDYLIYGIPRFILIDPDGNIIDHDARRPADPKLITEFNELGI